MLPALSQRYAVRLVKLVFALSTVSFVMLHMMHRSQTINAMAPEPVDVAHNQPQLPVVDAMVGVSAVDKQPLQQQLVDKAAAINDLNRLKADIREQQRQYDSSIDAPVAQTNMPTVDDIRASIEYNNEHGGIRNAELFPPIDNNTVVIVVQVHNRPKYLEKLVQSLSVARHIEKALVVFSHDYYSADINLIVRDIKFCKVAQIFFPYNIQIFPDEFPGTAPGDCGMQVKKEQAEKIKCGNWEHPDKYGHYRVANYAQIKHHWWWKMNYVWHGMAALKNFDGYVLLLEEDHFVSPDALHVLNIMIDNRKELCADCMVLSLGIYLKTYGTYKGNIGKLAIHPFFSSKHNMGLVMDRVTWGKIHNCSQLFCNYDDYNWDWSLMPIATKCFTPRLHVLFTKAPRVFHIGDCGVHTHKCRADVSAQKVLDVLTGVQDSLFPRTMAVAERSKRMMKPPKENGGWGDVRDHELCHNNTMH